MAATTPTFPTSRRRLRLPGVVGRPLNSLLGRLPAPVEARVRDRLGLDLFVVCAVVLVALRLFNVYPWTPWQLDMHTYWATGEGIHYGA